MFFAGFFCKRLSKKIIFILKLALTNYQPILMLLYKILCNILNKSLLSSPFSSQYSPSTPFLQEIFATCCTFLFFKIIIFFSKKAKAPEAGKPASRTIKLKCQNELLYFSKLSQSSKKSYMFTVRIPYSS